VKPPSGPIATVKPLAVFSNSIVREVLVSKENRATGVRYFNRAARTEGEVSGRCVVVACACVQSVALLMMSKSRSYPAGLANSSGEQLEGNPMTPAEQAKQADLPRSKHRGPPPLLPHAWAR